MRKRPKHKPYTAFKMFLLKEGFTYKDVAKLLDISTTTIQLKINGKSDFYLSEQQIICEAFKLSPEVFFSSSCCLNDNKNNDE